jgi:ankyrin repeat protein
MAASGDGQEAAVDYLLSVGADVNYRDKVGTIDNYLARLQMQF